MVERNVRRDLSLVDLSHIQNQLSGRTAGILTHTQMMNAAVILPLIKKNGELAVLFEVRAHHLNRQPGEICFPGGRIDATDLSPETAAVRELTEELGVKREEVHLIAPLDVLTTPFRGIIYPFVAELRNPTAIQVNKEEVDHVFSVPLSYLYENEPKLYEMGIHFEPGHSFPLKEIANGQSYLKRTNRVNEYFYYYDDYVIWGLTARILTHFIELTQKSRLLK